MQQEQRYTVDADVEVTNWMGALPADYTAQSLNATLENVAEKDLERKGMVAGSPDIAAQEVPRVHAAAGAPSNLSMCQIAIPDSTVGSNAWGWYGPRP